MGDDMEHNPTTWQFLSHVVGEKWARALWPVVRSRAGLAEELIDIAPRWCHGLTGDGRARYFDSHAGARASWISARANDVDQHRAALGIEA
jgi:hypothetical protein